MAYALPYISCGQQNRHNISWSMYISCSEYVMFYEGSNASAPGYGITDVRDRLMAAQLQTALQETEYKLQ